MQMSFDFAANAARRPVQNDKSAAMRSDVGAAMRRRAQFAQYPSSKQVAFAERIARIKRRAVPDACFKDRLLMSRWIDSNR